MRQIMIGLLLVLVLSSCEDFFETNLTLEEPDYDSQLVIGATLHTLDSIGKVYFTKSFGINQDANNINMSDATLWIENEKGETVTTFDTNPANSKGFFIPNQPFTFMEGQTYWIYGEHPGYDTAFAMTTVPEKVDLKSTSFIYHNGLSQWGEERSGIEVNFVDPPGERNFYRAAVFIKENSFSYSTWTSSVDPAVSISGEYDYVVFADDSFDGEEKSITFQFYKYAEHQLSNFEGIYLVWSTITEEQYRFDKTLRQFEDNRYNPFAAPTDIEGNIQNGLGFFGIENREVYPIEL